MTVTHPELDVPGGAGRATPESVGLSLVIL